jgi:hypothetical protein
LRRQCTTGNAFGGGAVVVANPDADHHFFRKADEPGIAMVLAGAGLAGNLLTVLCGGPPGPALNHGFKKAC